MSTLTKTYHFTSDTEGWVATTGAGTTQGRWYPPHRGNGSAHVFTLRRTNEPLITMGGCLRMSVRDGASSENYWELTKTWEALGVPVGATVTNVQANYLYRWGRFRLGNSIVNTNTATFLGTETGSGPFELRDSGGTLIDTFSARINGRTRDLGANYYVGYPTGDAFGTYTPIVEATPTGWGISTGSTLSVPAPQQASSATVKFRLRNLLPATSGLNNLIRIKQDYIVLTVTYTETTSTDPTGDSTVIATEDVSRVVEVATRQVVVNADSLRLIELQNTATIEVSERGPDGVQGTVSSGNNPLPELIFS